MTDHREDDALVRWLQSRVDDWRELDALFSRQHGRTDDVAEVRRAVSDFRSLASDLSLARQALPGSRIHQWLEALFLKGHQVIYRAPGNTLMRLRDIYAFESPELIRGMRGLLLATIALFAGSIAAGWLLVHLLPNLATLFVSTEMINRVEGGALWTSGLLNIVPSSTLSIQLMTNNITVSLFAFALGALYGMGTLYIITLNGLMLGGTFAFVAQHRLADELFEFIIAHGVVELSVVCIAGAMGLRLGEALLRPGNRTRAHAFREATGNAGKVLIVAVPFLILAGLIEGYISPAEHYDLSFRLAVGLVSGTLFWLLLIFGLPWLKR